MFGISPLGWVHTLGSLPAIPAAMYMFARHGRIVPQSTAGAVYFVSMLIGAATVFLVTHDTAGYGIGLATLLLLLAGYGVGMLPSLARQMFASGSPRDNLGHQGLDRAASYIETICLSLTAFLLMLPTVTEILRRVPDGHPLVTNLNAPLLLGSQAGLLVLLIAGLSAQIIHLRRRDRIVTVANLTQPLQPWR